MGKKLNIKQMSANFLLVCGMVSALCATFAQVKDTFFPAAKEAPAPIEAPLEEEKATIEELKAELEQALKEQAAIAAAEAEQRAVASLRSPFLPGRGKPSLLPDMPSRHHEEAPRMDAAEMIKIQQLKGKIVELQIQQQQQQQPQASTMAPEDSTNYTWIVILVISLAAVGGGIILRKKIVKEVKEAQ